MTNRTWNERLDYALKRRDKTPADLARATKNKPASVSEWLSGKTKMMGATNALLTCSYLNISMDWLFLGREPSGLDGHEVAKSVEDDTTLSLPIMNAAASMGIGNELPDQEVVIDTLRVSKEWALKIKPLSSITNLSFIHALGDSMLPTFKDGDILLVDSGIKSVMIDGVYVLEAHHRLFIKRVRQRIDGQFEISSDNPHVKTVDLLSGEHEVKILGRVVWVWNGQKL